ncbi:MAG TPA: efflux RND transporter periplasmic adaptor subunit [Solimonas sp.]|nr:efflux RND transporter periplasmic adaptor subunit [Solimonas sp.]
MATLRPLLTLPLAIALLATACSKPAAEAPAPRPVLVENPQPLAGEAGEVFPGTVRAREEADLAFRVPGKITGRRVDAGQLVKPGDVLATLDPVDARLNTDAAQAAVAAAEADVKLMQAEVVRHKEMLDKGFISRSLFEVRENNLNLAQARLEQARSSLAVVRNQAAYTRLVADKAGVIAAVLAEVGQVVAAGQPVLRFAADAGREVLIAVPEGRVDALKAAPALGVVLWSHPDKVYAGKLREVSPQAERSTRTHEARVTIVGAADDVPLGVTASVRMGARMEQSQFRLPLTALGEAGGKPAVFRVDNGTVKAVPVSVLRYEERGAIVTGALADQDQILTAGVHLVVQGQAVRAMPRKIAQAAP